MLDLHCKGGYKAGVSIAYWSVAEADRSADLALGAGFVCKEEHG